MAVALSERESAGLHLASLSQATNATHPGLPPRGTLDGM